MPVAVVLMVSLAFGFVFIRTLDWDDPPVVSNTFYPEEVIGDATITIDARDLEPEGNTAGRTQLWIDDEVEWEFEVFAGDEDTEINNTIEWSQTRNNYVIHAITEGAEDGSCWLKFTEE